MASLRDLYTINDDGSYAPLKTTQAAPQSNNIGDFDYGAWLASQRQDTPVAPVASVPDPSPQDLANYNQPAPIYQTNSDGSYQPLPTAPGDGTRTAEGGYVNNVIPQQYVNAGSLIQTAQQMGVNPATYGALNLVASYAPEYQSVPNVGNMSTMETPKPIDLQSGQVDSQTPLQNANVAYLGRLANEQSNGALRTQSTENQQAFNSMMLNSPIYNPNGANTYAIQHNTQSPIPLFAETAPAPYNPGGTVANPTTPLPQLSNTTTTTNTNSNTPVGWGGYYDEYGFGQGPKYNQWDDTRKVNSNRRNMNFGRALWR